MVEKEVDMAVPEGFQELKIPCVRCKAHVALTNIYFNSQGDIVAEGRCNRCLVQSEHATSFAKLIASCHPSCISRDKTLMDAPELVM